MLMRHVIETNFAVAIAAYHQLMLISAFACAVDYQPRLIHEASFTVCLPISGLFTERAGGTGKQGCDKHPSCFLNVRK